MRFGTARRLQLLAAKEKGVGRRERAHTTQLPCFLLPGWGSIACLALVLENQGERITLLIRPGSSANARARRYVEVGRSRAPARSRGHLQVPGDSIVQW